MSKKKKRGGWNRPPSYGNLRHGAYGTRAYSTWRNMKTRCLNPNNAMFKEYCGRGISVCQRWMNFVNFLEDMGQPPAGMSLSAKTWTGTTNLAIAFGPTTKPKQTISSLRSHFMAKECRSAKHRGGSGSRPNAISSHMTRTGMTFDETVSYMKGSSFVFG